MVAAEAEAYGTDTLCRVLKPTPIELDDSDSDSSEPPEPTASHSAD
jgi:hypothetical protein